MKPPRYRLCAAALMLALPLAAAPAVAAEPAPGPDSTARLAPLRQTSGQPVPGHYIVTLRKGSSPRTLTSRLGVVPDFVYTHALTGFAATLTPEQLEAVRGASDVEAVEEDAVYSQADEDDAPATRTRAPTQSWGLDRVDQHRLPLDGQFSEAATGEGGTAYIVDTGIDYGHPEFGGRARNGTDLVTSGGDGKDCPSGSGHGTHVAGVVGGATYGVARKATLVSVRVLDCTGRTTAARVAAAFEYVAANAPAASVVNASLSGPPSRAIDTAVGNVAAKGVLPVVAAGNNNDSACDHSPSGALAALAVGATNQRDQMTDFSNSGPCARILAPGEDIVSAAPGGGTATKSGTSQASPYVTGVATLYKARTPSATSDAVIKWLVEQSTKDVVTDLKAGTPNRLLFTGGL
ncbi:peptidase S8 [Streptomyces cinnamoneus]|uniref:Peptidase S8 n=1 Tax=Streptomyces cinnamoneus TaxID=53446 RepID=A0A2G1XBM7_STRCJ|nr:S8 family peptidase [Streptomyces cinnamoneus]PHQ48657.1 peptidase S8 [Streptomyces cinnamoneus]PPT12663.1 peptidase S8 [Streptomyces cinnamoneus]